MKAFKIIGALALCLALAAPAAAQGSQPEWVRVAGEVWLDDAQMLELRDPTLARAEGSVAYLTANAEETARIFTQHFGEVSQALGILQLDLQTKTSWATVDLAWGRASAAMTAPDMRRLLWLWGEQAAHVDGMEESQVLVLALRHASNLSQARQVFHAGELASLMRGKAGSRASARYRDLMQALFLGDDRAALGVIRTVPEEMVKQVSITAALATMPR